MNKPLLFSGCFCCLAATAYATPAERDTTRVVDVEEIVIVASPKENIKFRQQALSSSVLSREQLQDNGVTSVKNLTSLVPNFYMPDYGSKLTSAIYIRGIGSRINTPAIGLYVDNVPYLDKSAFDFNLYDIERIDVLRGPQSTLYGRNTMGGLIRVYTRNPFRHQGTHLSLGGALGNNSYQASLTHYHRISERFAFSAGGFYEGARGFFKNEYTGHYADPMQSGGGRLRAIWLPLERWKLDVTANYEYSDEGGYAYGLYDAETGRTAAVASGQPGSYRRGLFNAGVSATWQGDHFIFNSVTSYQHLKDRMFMDQDFLPEDRYILEQKQRMNSFTEELSIKSVPSRRWQWVTGLFASHQRLHTACPVTFGSDGMTMLEDLVNSKLPTRPAMNLDFEGNSMEIPSGFNTPVTGLAIFHQSTLNDFLLDGLSLTVGLRLDHERISLDYDTGASVGYAFSMQMLPEALRSNVSSRLEGELSNHYTQLLPKFSLTYEWREGNNVYATVSKGYRSGGYNIQMFSDVARSALQTSVMNSVREQCYAAVDEHFPGQAEMIKGMIDKYMPTFSETDVRTTYYRPEYAWSYEVGSHLTLWQGKLQADLAAFWMDIRNQQIARMVASGMGRQMVNAGRSRSLGVEASLSATIDRHLETTLSYGFTRATFRDYDAGSSDGETTADYTGNTVPFVPRHTLNVGAAYTCFLKDDHLRRVTFHANYAAVGHVYWNEANSMRQGFYGTWNGNVTFHLNHCEVDLWGRNLLGRDYSTFGIESLGRWFIQQGKPRQLGINLRLNI